MAHQSQPSRRTGNPLGDLTNTYQTGDTVPHDAPQEQEDSKARRKVRDRERYAAMSREKKDENNKKRRERRMKKKADAIEAVVSIDEDEGNEWLHRGHLRGNSDVPAGGEILISAEANGDCIHDSCMDSTIEGAGGEVLISAEENGEGIHDSCMDSTIPEGVLPHLESTTNSYGSLPHAQIVIGLLLHMALSRRVPMYYS